jgi:hypothetical protein
MAKTCNNCGTNEEMAMMPIAQHEKDQNRLMSIIKWLIGVIVVLLVLFAGSNIARILYEAQFETVEETIETDVTQENENGYNNYIGNDGDINNGETDDKS